MQGAGDGQPGLREPDFRVTDGESSIDLIRNFAHESPDDSLSLGLSEGYQLDGRRHLTLTPGEEITVGGRDQIDAPVIGGQGKGTDVAHVALLAEGFCTLYTQIREESCESPAERAIVRCEFRCLSGSIEKSGPGVQAGLVIE